MAEPHVITALVRKRADMAGVRHSFTGLEALSS